MKQVLLSAVAVLLTVATFAQADTTTINTPKSDSAKNRSAITISSGSDDLLDIKIGNNSSKKKKSSVTTDWWIFDLGFTNFRDETNYTTAQAGSYFKMLRPQDGMVSSKSMDLTPSKSSNVNIWFFMQRFNLSKQKLNLKYGLGLEMYNFRYERSLSYRKNPENFVFNDSINFSKNKLYAGYITLPFMINFTPNPEHKKSLSISAGISAGYLISSRNKQISNERGKEKIRGNFDLEPFRLAIIGELGLGKVRLYGSYSLNTLHKSSTGLQQYPFAFGIRFSSL